MTSAAMFICQNNQYQYHFFVCFSYHSALVWEDISMLSSYNRAVNCNMQWLPNHLCTLSDKFEKPKKVFTDNFHKSGADPGPNIVTHSF